MKCLLPLFLVLVSCTQQQAKTAVTATVKIGADVCHEIEDNAVAGSDWVHLVCTVLDAGGGIVNVIMPRTDWAAAKARKLDAGPGK
jgi:hypothetical protein